MIENGSINDPAHIEREIMQRVDWLRGAVVAWLLGGALTRERYTEMAARLRAEAEHWEQSEAVQG